MSNLVPPPFPGATGPETDCRWCSARDERAVPAVEVLTAGCVHEHLRDIPVCRHHGDEAAMLAAMLDLFCTPCRFSAQVHLCPVTIMRTRQLAST